MAALQEADIHTAAPGVICSHLGRGKAGLYRSWEAASYGRTWQGEYGEKRGDINPLRLFQHVYKIHYPHSGSLSLSLSLSLSAVLFYFILENRLWFGVSSSPFSVHLQ